MDSLINGLDGWRDGLIGRWVRGWVRRVDG